MVGRKGDKKGPVGPQCGLGNVGAWVTLRRQPFAFCKSQFPVKSKMSWAGGLRQRLETGSQEVVLRYVLCGQNPGSARNEFIADS